MKLADLEVFVVGRLVALELDLGGGVCRRRNLLSQFQDRYRLITSHIEDPTDSLFRAHQAQYRMYDIVHVCEAANLLTVIVHNQRSARQRSFDKAGQYHSIRAGLTRANHIEEPCDDNWQAVLAGGGQRQEFVNRL